MNALERFEEAARRYLPDQLRVLFITEAPPAFRVNRLFYFTGLTDGDTLFLEMMKVLYPVEVGYIKGTFQPGSSVKQMRLRKPELLRNIPKRRLSFSLTLTNNRCLTARTRRPKPV
jgi:hypothetical protein